MIWVILTKISRSRHYWDAEYLRTVSNKRHSYNGILIWSYMRPAQGCHFMTLSDLAKYSMTQSIARSLCDSWAFCPYTVMMQSRLTCLGKQHGSCRSGSDASDEDRWWRPSLECQGDGRRYWTGRHGGRLRHDDSGTLTLLTLLSVVRTDVHCENILNPLITTLKPQSNGPSYSNTVIGTVAVDGWAVTFGTARRGLGGAAARPEPSSLCQI